MADTNGPKPAEQFGAEATPSQPAPFAQPAPAAQPAPLEQPTGYESYTAASGGVPAPNLAVGITAGFGFGLLAAIVYAGVAIVAEREFLMLGLLIGFAIAFGFHRFGHTRGVVPGLIAAVIALVMYTLAIFIETAGVLTKIYDESFIDALRLTIQYPSDVFATYFSDALSYVFVVVSVVMAFYYAWGGRQGAAQEQEEPAAAADDAADSAPAASSEPTA